MASWNRPVITNKGIELMNNALNNANIQITNIKISSRKYTDNIQNLTTLEEIKKTIPISSITKLTDNKIKISAIINNENENQGYNLETIGIYNNDNLFAVITAIESDFIPRNTGTGLLTINFELILNVNKDTVFTMNYNSNALLTNKDLDTIIQERMKVKANSNEVITNITASGGTITYTKNNQNFNLTVAPQITDAMDTIAGKISKNTVKELATAKINELLPEIKITELSFNKMKEYGLGLTTTNSGHRNDYKANGFYAYGWQGGGIGNKTTGIFNIQYADRYGVQLAITQEDKTKAYIRAKNNGSWTSDKELMQVDDFNLYANAYLGNSEVKALNGRNAVSVRDNDILVYDTNNKRYYYKSKINGNITIPTEENTEKLMLGSGSGMGFSELKRKLMIGGVEGIS